MAVLQITYDLRKPGKDYADVLKTIKTYSWARLSESCYAISTDATAQSVFDRLKPYLDGNDNLYVINLKRPYAGIGPKDVNDWLEKFLPR
ncbi:hypothetical protein [Paraburkholderia sp. RL17-347-BIC-D]|uniref:hypothetical protein n=1 Tax=Paraburkholderia sp. RL17-347-BIC-D TaxID=3031632 RepID=UPI0038BA381C